MVKKCVITIDVKGSRKLEAVDRETIHFRIFGTIDEISRFFSQDLFAIGMTAGDEFQVVFNSPESSIDVYRFVNPKLPCYFGVGFGEITHLGTHEPSEMYGPGFYLSRNAIEMAKKTKRSNIVFRVGDELLDFELNTLFELLTFIESKQTKRQKEIIAFLSSHESEWQKFVAEHFNISEQAVSKIRKKSGFELIQRTEHLSKTLLGRRLQESPK